MRAHQRGTKRGDGEGNLETKHSSHSGGAPGATFLEAINMPHVAPSGIRGGARRTFASRRKKRREEKSAAACSFPGLAVSGT